MDDRKPTHVFDKESIFAYPPDWENVDGKCFSFGKWLVFRKHEELDETWQLIKTHVRSGYLGKHIAKCLTMVRTETSGTNGVICVFTSKDDIDEIGLKLIKLVLDKKLVYKTNAATTRNLYTVYGVRKTTYKTLFWNDGDPQFDFDPLYGKWTICCKRKENPDLMLQKVREAVDDGAQVREYRSDAKQYAYAHIAVFTTEEDVDKVGYNLIKVVKRDITFKTTNPCGGPHEKIHLRWNKGNPYAERFTEEL